MTTIKALTVVMLLSATVATPTFAKGKIHHQSFRGAYNQVIEPSYAARGFAIRAEY